MSSHLHHSHAEEDIVARLQAGPSLNYLRDWVYGGIDGAVTTFAIVAGAELSVKTILILGLANVIADGFSMAASNYSGTKTERDEYDQLRAHEIRQIERDPNGEREEVRQIYRLKGFAGADLDRAVEIITGDRERWVESMMIDEWGMRTAPRDPMTSAVSTFFAFLACGVVPLLPFVFHADYPFLFASILTGLVFFFIGSAKSRWSLSSWWRSGLETFAIGVAAALMAYGVGVLLKGIV